MSTGKEMTRDHLIEKTRGGKKEQTMADLITLKYSRLVPLLTYSDDYSSTLATCISSIDRELKTTNQSPISLSKIGSAKQL